MSIMHPRNTPAAPCPTCDLPGEGVSHADAGVVTANYLCPAGHIWLTKWAVA